MARGGHSGDTDHSHLGGQGNYLGDRDLSLLGTEIILVLVLGDRERRQGRATNKGRVERLLSLFPAEVTREMMAVGETS